MTTTRPAKLSDDDLADALATLPGWRLEPAGSGASALARDLLFTDFSAAFGFMTRAALLAERMDHHPDWRNVWNRLEIRLWTHDRGGITALDVALARAMEQLLP
ncbi:MAG: 4a-hydroxytetrahydrobiopterin dehydratase [Myxococcales bacterium]|nr:4a-hydroxytetrahydrobiopterin dehydratase [Myxococcales bacterium]